MSDLREHRTGRLVFGLLIGMLAGLVVRDERAGIGMIGAAGAITAAIVIHELGHLLVALRARIIVERFIIGFGPVVGERIVGRVRVELRALPIGGAVVFPEVAAIGDRPPGETPWEEAHPVKRVLVTIAGPITGMASVALVFFVLALGKGYAPDAAFVEMLDRLGRLSGAIGATFGAIVGVFTGEANSGLAGPVGIFSAAPEGIATYGPILFFALLSWGISVANLLPIPPLDGGGLLRIVVRALFGERHGARAERAVTAAGYLAFAYLVTVITIADVTRLIS